MSSNEGDLTAEAAEAPAGAAVDAGSDGEAAPEERSDEGAKVSDEDATAEQVEATAEAIEAEGHAEQTAAGTAEDAVTDAPTDAPPATDTDTAAEATAEEAPAEPAPEPEPEPVDPTSPVSEDELRLGLLQVFKDELGDAVVGAHIRDGDDLWVRVTAEAWRDAAQLAKSRLGCTSFSFLSAIDWLPSVWGRSEDSPFDETPGPEAAAEDVTEFETGYAGGETRFQVFLRVANPTKGYGITIKCDIADPEVGVATMIPVYPGSNWHEREAHEMYGIGFIGHPNLAKLYLPGAFEGFPLRKDFPLLARQVKPWPGIVDVEPMPGGSDDEDADASAEEAAS